MNGPDSTLRAASGIVPLLAAALLLSALPARARVEPPLWPDVSYDPAIPTFRSVLGYEPGESIATPEEILRWFEALQEAAPDRVRVYEYARSFEGRPLVYVAVGSAENVARIDEIQAGMRALADPRETKEGDAQRLIASLPAVIWLGYGVHGNEISSPDAAMFTAYHLLAAQGDPIVEAIRRHVLVLIDPSQNPDGRNRFVQSFRQGYGIRPDPDRLSAEHDEPWPGGRTSHYLFDLNRDWITLTHPETRGRVRVLQEWYPLVFVDLHEMSGDATYYFAPEAVPYNPHLTAEQNAKLELFGRNNAKWFDRYGFDYFTREVYDAFYPGYGASWPAYYGAVAMTYEEASPRGLALLRADGDVLTFREAVRHHFVASVSTAETAAANRELLLRDFWKYRKSAIEEGRSGDLREIVLPYRGNRGNVNRLAGLLVQQGADVERATGEITSCGVRYPAGSYVVPMAQPAKRLLRNLLDPQVDMDADFLAEQERRRAKRMGDQIYDVTAWSLPLQFGIEAVPCASASSGPREPAGPELVRPTEPPGEARLAYAVPWAGNEAGALLSRALREGLVALSPDVSFTQGGRRFPAGTLVFKLDDNPDDLRERLARLARETGAEVVPLDSGWVEEGVNFGSARVARIRAPRIALAWDVPTSASSAGATRYVLEQRYEFPVTVIRTRTLARADLSRYQTLVLPPGRDYRDVLGEGGIARLRSWIESGGTLVAIESAIDFLAHPDVALLPTERQRAAQPDQTAENGPLLETEADYLDAIRPENPEPDAVAGVLLRARPDADHWMSVGLPDPTYVLYGGSAVYEPLRLDEGWNALRFAGREDLLASGYLWAENRALLAHKPFVMVREQGRGLVVAFTADPTLRGYLDGLDLLLLNAVFRGPAHARPNWR